MVLFVTLGFGLIGFADDYAKVTKQTHQGRLGAGAAGRWASLIALLAGLCVRRCICIPRT